MGDGDLQALAAEALGEIAAAADLEQLESVRRRFLGRGSGRISALSRLVVEAPAGERAALGAAFNQAKSSVERALRERAAELTTQEARRPIDLSYSGGPLPRGHQHPVRRLIREIEDVAATLGYQTVGGPEIEDQRHHFELLNMPPDHPARDSQDTFYLGEELSGMLLRGHTSPMQVRWMLAHRPPYRIIVPGKVYRRDNPDPTHNPAFHQVEGLCVGRGINLSHLKGTLAYFISALFGRDRPFRFRSSFFPYTEPSLEVDVRCWFCQGSGCQSCHQKGWIEILGCGLVHPSVLSGAGVDPAVYSGFAFGMGPDRIAALKYGIADIRELYQNDTRFLAGF